ncbi:MAG: hypothetical protein AAGF11_08385 [Myxococcota bacterium]
MTAPPRGAATIAAAWDADSGPPNVELLPRADRRGVSFSTRILAHVLGRVVAGSPEPLSSVPWVLGVGEGSVPALVPGSVLRRILAPERGLVRVDAGAATVPMTLIEALAHLVDHPAVLVAFVADATPPYHEALAAAWLLTRESRADAPLVLGPPVLRRTSSYSERAPRAEHPLASALRLARAIDVGQPTVETVSSGEPDRPGSWRIELCAAF